MRMGKRPVGDHGPEFQHEWGELLTKDGFNGESAGIWTTTENGCCEMLMVTTKEEARAMAKWILAWADSQ